MFNPYQVQKTKLVIEGIPCINPAPGTPKVERELLVTLFTNHVYRDIKDDLLIKFGEVSGELICIGAFDREKEEVVCLTPEKVQKCREYGLKIEEKN